MVDPVDCTAVQMNSAVSKPSRATATKAVRVRAPVPMARATSMRSWRSPFRWRAVRRIQKIIHVTNTTAMIDITPPKVSWALKVSDLDVKVSRAPAIRLMTTAAPTPSQMERRAFRRSVRTT